MPRRLMTLTIFVSLLANLLFLTERLFRRIDDEESSHGITVMRNTNKQQTIVQTGLCSLTLGTGHTCESYGGHHTQRLTHVIIPFHTSQVNRVEANLRSWLEMTPCSAAAGQPATPNGPFHLVLYSSADLKKKQYLVELETRLQAAISNLTSEVTSCFQSIEIQHAGLTGPSDTYYRGTRLMIEKLILAKIKLQYAPQYAFYMEPDCMPIRPNWLNALDVSTRWPSPPFWMRGSIYRGNNKGVYATRYPPQAFHMNGNALYNLGDRSFRSWYVKHYRPFANAAQGSGKKDRSFDTDFYRFLHDLDNVMVTRNIIHRFQYTDIVQNWWRSSYSLSKMRTEHPGTYFIHGGYPKA